MNDATNTLNSLFGGSTTLGDILNDTASNLNAVNNAYHAYENTRRDFKVNNGTTVSNNTGMTINQPVQYDFPYGINNNSGNYMKNNNSSIGMNDGYANQNYGINGGGINIGTNPMLTPIYSGGNNIFTSGVVAKYQNEILRPHTVVDYSSIVMNSYPVNAIQNEAIIGYKVLCQDTRSHSMNAGDRLRFIEQNVCRLLMENGLLLRETDPSISTTGLWLISLPVTRKNMSNMLNNMFAVLNILEQYFGIVKTGLIEVTVSGKCHLNEFETAIKNITIPHSYTSMLIPTNGLMCPIGHIIRINEWFMLLKTRWDFSSLSTNSDALHETMAVLPQLISAIYK